MDIESATCGLQLHMGMHDFIHLQAEETLKKRSMACMKLKDKYGGSS